MTRERHDFIRDIIDADLAAGRHQRVATRFPPEPNGYLHIGHAKSICLNFGLARDYRGTCNLRYDDTNPTKEDVEYVTSIEADVRWLGFAPNQVLFSADYFEQMYAWALDLVRAGKAYVCDLTEEDIRAYRGTLSEPGRPSPYRERPVAENLDLFARMRAGEFPDGARTLRAKIDMSASNMKMRDPLLYRIRHAHHHRVGDAWCIYPMYDYAHPLEDAIEGITHSICTLEFENNRELYDWVLAATGAGGTTPPRQYEFARLALDYTIMSKRKLLQLVEGGHVQGWDDPRMPTLAGMRRRGYAPAAIRAFCDMVGVAKNNSTVDIGKLEYCVRDELNQHAPRVLAVVRPVRLEISNWAELSAQASLALEAPYFPADVGKPGSRTLTMSAALWVDADDVRATPSPDFYRLAPGQTVRLRYAYGITCDAVETDGHGHPTLVRARVLPETAQGAAPANGAEIKGVIHWLDAATAVTAELRLYDRLFLSAKPEEGGADFLTQLNPQSLVRAETAKVEPGLAQAAVGSRWQFERTGYFVVDLDSQPSRLVFNRVISLRDQPASKPASGPQPPVEKKTNAKAQTRPKSKSPAEYREEARKRNPTLAAHYHAFSELLGSTSDADVLTGDIAMAEFFAAVAQTRELAPQAAKWLINELPRALSERTLETTQLTPARLVEFLQRLEAKTLSPSLGKKLLPRMLESTASLDDLLAAEAPPQAKVDQASAIAALLSEQAGKVAEYRQGKRGLIGFFVGQLLRAHPSLDAAEAKAALEAALG